MTNKAKKKLVFAKDKKQAVIAITVISLFLANTIFMIGKGIVENIQSSSASTNNAKVEGTTKYGALSEQPASPESTTQANTDPNASAMGNVSPVPTTETGSVTNPAESLNSTTPNEPQLQNPQPETASLESPTGFKTAEEEILATNQGQQTPNFFASNPNILAIPIALIIFLLLGLGGYQYYQKKLKPSQRATNADKGSKNKTLSFAKDERQATLAIVLLSLFVANGTYIITKNIAMNLPAQTTVANNTSTATPSPQPGEQIAQDANNIYQQTVNMQDGNVSPAVQQEAPVLTNDLTAQMPTSGGDDIEIMVKNKQQKKNQKMVMISVAGSGRTNPFLPASENITPSSLAYLTAPPENLPSDSDAGKVMTTTISGILYDKYNPSAIINIENTDYLVKKGDVINRYKILSITKNQVLVQLGRNVYKAGVGELLSPTGLNYNTIANLEKKFGGNEVTINVKKGHKTGSK